MVTKRERERVVTELVREGQVLDGKFRVERIVGEGAMGLVVEATHLSLDERVALKFLRQEGQQRPDIAARFAWEARAAAKIKSDHVARVFDVGTTEDGTPFIVMEFLEGSDLASILELRRRLDVEEAVEYVIQACEGLADAHARGIIHRDVKPENLFLAHGAGALKQVKILDFGISKASLDTDPTTAHTTQIMGSPHYMSPDQIRNTHNVDARADVWSLGVVLFELLSGEMPFTATDVTALISQILHEPHRKLRSVHPGLAPELEAVVDRCLAKNPSDRFATAADLAIALLPFAPKRSRAIVEKAAAITRSVGGAGAVATLESRPPPSSRSSGAVPVAPVAGKSTDSALGTSVTPTPPPAARRGPGPVVWVAAAVVLLIGLGASAFALFWTGNPSRGTATPGPSASAGEPSGWATIAVEPATAPVPIDQATGEPVASGAPSRTAPIRTMRPVQSAPPPTKPPPPSRPPETDIRLER